MKTIILTGGGTAGHVTPNLALIPSLKAAGYDIRYIGSYNGMERKLIENAGIPYDGISSGKLRRYFDYIIIDCPAGIGDMLDVALRPADQVVIVTEPEAASLRDADVTERYIRENGVTNTVFIINKVRVELMKAGFVPDLATILNMFKNPVVGMIQDDDNIHISTNKGIPIVCKKGTYIEKNFQDIADKITGLM